MEPKPTIKGAEKSKLFCKLRINSEDCKSLRNTKLFPFVIFSDTNLIGRVEADKHENYRLNFFMSYCSVKQTEISLETNTATIILRYYNGVELIESEFTTGILSKFGSRELLAKGIRFKEDEINYVIEYLLRSATLAPTVKSFTKHGFVEKDENLSYYYRSLLGNTKQSDLFVYRGDKDLASHGELTKWIEMIQSDIIGNQALEFVMLSSFASPIIAALNLRYDLGSLLIHLTNHSSKGKTTAAMLAASIWGNPMLNRGTAISYNSTENALADFISGCNGMCVVLDESSVMQTSNLQKFLFEVTLGRSKMRLQGDGTQRPVKEYSSVIISTSETPFIDEETILGIKARVFEITDDLTNSAEHSDKIKSIVINNYALAAEPFLEYLISLGLSQIVQDYESSKLFLINQFRQNCFSSCENSIADRVLSKLALFLMARDYLEKVFSININRDLLVNYLLRLSERIDLSPSMETRILNLVFADVTENGADYHDYPAVQTYADKARPIYGIIRESTEQGYQEVGIISSRFEKLLKDNRIPKTEANKALRSLRKSGHLIAPSDRVRVRITLSDSRPDSLFYLFRYLPNQNQVA